MSYVIYNANLIVVPAFCKLWKWEMSEIKNYGSAWLVPKEFKCIL